MGNFWFYIEMGLNHVLDLSAYDQILFYSLHQNKNNKLEIDFLYNVNKTFCFYRPLQYLLPSKVGKRC